MSGFYYLSQPYNGSEAEKQFRYEAGAKMCLALLEKGLSVFSPIVHNHNLLAYADQFSVEKRRALFLPFDLTMLDRAKGMFILTLPGWEASYGVQMEIDFCQKKQKPMHYFSDPAILLKTLGLTATTDS